MAPCLYSCLACITAYNIDVRWLGVGHCILCVLCGLGVGEWDWDFVGSKLLVLRFEYLCGVQTFDELDEDRGKSAYRLCLAVRDTLYDILELAKRILHLEHAPFVIRSHPCKELIYFQLEHV